MKLFNRLKADAAPQWQSYVAHPFVIAMGDGSLAEPAFRHYLEQDYLFLLHFARAYALAIYKSPSLADMRTALEGVKAILDVELDLHIELCSGWGMSPADLEACEEDGPTMAYTRYVLETGMSGDLLDLQVALAPCIIGYAEISKALAARPGALEESNRYSRWIAEYSGPEYQEVADMFAGWMDTLAGTYLTDARYPRLQTIFRRATVLEADFWQMGLDRA